MPQAEFATAIDRAITSQRWNNYVSGRNRITVEVAIAMRNKFDLTLDWIYCGDASGLPQRLYRKIEEITAGEVADFVDR
jgi:hypothetical protein